MEEKEFDINNEEGILAKFDFYYCYNSEQCSKELCMFFNDISLNKRKDFDKRQAFIDLGRIAITLNQQDQRIKELEEENQQLKEENGYIIFADGYDEDGNEIHRQEFVKYKDKFKELVEENKQLKQSQKQLAISELEKIYNLFEPYENSQKDTILCANNDISFIDYLKNRIKELKGDKNEI